MSQDLLTTATSAARAGGEILRRAFRAEDLAVERKGRHDYVTRVDYESEEAVLEVIRRRHPDHAILAEEGGREAGAAQSDGGEADCQWLVDPLDGTTNFLKQLPFFAVSVACRCRGELVAAVVLDPLRNDLFGAARGLGATLNGQPIRVSSRAGLDDAFVATGFPFRHSQAVRERYFASFHRVFERVSGVRRCGSAALDLAYTASGVFDGFWEYGLAPWDIAAGALLVREAGGVITDDLGEDGFLASGNVVAGPAGLHRELLAEATPSAAEELAVGAEA
ncbi:MAG: inositol monophosphatase family protein [Acidobacteriota bacterium]|nr:inositol monophosphatase family protein [Acidobacteriota bacterium]